MKCFTESLYSKLDSLSLNTPRQGRKREFLLGFTRFEGFCFEAKTKVVVFVTKHWSQALDTSFPHYVSPKTSTFFETNTHEIGCSIKVFDVSIIDFIILLILQEEQSLQFSNIKRNLLVLSSVQYTMHTSQLYSKHFTFSTICI